MTTNIFERQMTLLSRATLKTEEQNGENMRTITIGEFVSPEFQGRYAQPIARIRALCTTLEDKERHKDQVAALKRKLPAGIISGVAEGGIGSDHIVERNGVIAIDIDAKDNPDIHDWEAARNYLASLPFVAYAGYSVSKLGLFALIPIADPQCHREHFDALVQDFARQGFILDPAPSNISSKRFVSHDPAPYVNLQAELYEKKSGEGQIAREGSLEPRPGMLRHVLQQLMTPQRFDDLPPFDLEGFLRDHAIDYEARPRQGGTQYVVRCPWAHLHSSHSYADSALFRYADGRIGYKCLHAHCADRTWHDFREFYEA